MLRQIARSALYPTQRDDLNAIVNLHRHGARHSLETPPTETHR